MSKFDGINVSTKYLDLTPLPLLRVFTYALCRRRYLGPICVTQYQKKKYPKCCQIRYLPPSAETHTGDTLWAGTLPFSPAGSPVENQFSATRPTGELLAFVALFQRHFFAADDEYLFLKGATFLVDTLTAGTQKARVTC